MNNITPEELKLKMENLSLLLNKKREEADKILVEIENICRDIINTELALNNVTKNTDIEPG